MAKKHDHVYGRIAAGHTGPGAKTLTWKACGICGQEDPDNKRPADAVDTAPKETSE